MLTAKYHKKLPLSIIKRCPDLLVKRTSDYMRTSEEESVWFSFSNDEGKCVGAVNLQWEEFKFIDGIPLWRIYIALFEICEDCRGNGYGGEAVKWLEALPVYEIDLNHMCEEDDGGKSKRFWEHMGWRNENRFTSSMMKTINRKQKKRH